jgi:hypothetical protein
MGAGPGKGAGDRPNCCQQCSSHSIRTHRIPIHGLEKSGLPTSTHSTGRKQNLNLPGTDLSGRPCGRTPAACAFSGGPGICPARHLVPMLASAMLAALLAAGRACRRRRGGSTRAGLSRAPTTTTRFVSASNSSDNGRVSVPGPLTNHRPRPWGPQHPARQTFLQRQSRVRARLQALRVTEGSCGCRPGSSRRPRR